MNLVPNPETVPANSRMDWGTYLLLGIPYIFLYPFVAISFIGLLGLVFPPDFQKILAQLHSSFYIWASLVVVLAFVVALFYTSTRDTGFRVLVRTHRYACLFAPSFAGGQGFALPAPFPLSALINIPAPASLRINFVYLCITWLVIFVFLGVAYALRRRQA